MIPRRTADCSAAGTAAPAPRCARAPRGLARVRLNGGARRRQERERESARFGKARDLSARLSWRHARGRRAVEGRVQAAEAALTCQERFIILRSVFESGCRLVPGLRTIESLLKSHRTRARVRWNDRSCLNRVTGNETELIESRAKCKSRPVCRTQEKGGSPPLDREYAARERERRARETGPTFLVERPHGAPHTRAPDTRARALSLSRTGRERRGPAVPKTSAIETTLFTTSCLQRDSKKSLVLPPQETRAPSRRR